MGYGKITTLFTQGNQTHDGPLYLYSITLHWQNYLLNVAPILKIGNELHAVIYRPVSLICITCNLFEHIMCKHIFKSFFVTP